MTQDYYMADIRFCGKEWGKWNMELRELPLGKSFQVETEDDRRNALNMARRMGIRVATKKLLSGGYVVVRMDGPKRRRGKPKIRL